MLLAQGCGGGSVYQRPRGEVVGNQGASWDSVLGGAGAQPSWELSRLDDSMNIRTIYGDGPSLDDLVRVYIDPRADQFWYYSTRGYRRY